MPEKFEIKKSKDGQYYFNLIAINNEIIATREMYTTKQNYKNGIDAVKRYASTAEISEK